MKELNLPESGSLEFIYQVSDIHIRSGDEDMSRFDEYEIAFNNLHDELSKLQPIILKTAAIVITGDTFHNKSRIESPGIKLFNMLITKLSSLAPVYIILGNHDFKQDGTVNIDFLEAFLYEQRKNIDYLNHTGLYVAGDVGFGLTSIKDVLEIGSGSGISQDMPKFPFPNFNENVKTTVALFHGTMNSSKMNDTRISSTGYAWEWIDVGYDIAMLGDIHKYQSFKRQSGMIAAYSGSLIQQNFGESLRNHGILEWNLQEKEFRHIEIRNNYGYLKLFLCHRPDDTFYWRNENEDLDDLLLWSKFPKKIKIRLYGNHTKEQRLKLDNILNNHVETYIIADVFVENVLKITDSVSSMVDFTSFDAISNFMRENSVPDYKKPDMNDFLFDYQDLGNEISSICYKKNLELEKELNKYDDFIETFKPKHLIRLSFFQWSGLLCYSGLNWFDFQLTKNFTNLLSGRNGSGKSSFLELISIAIYGKPIPSRKTKGTMKSIISYGKQDKTVSFTKIDIQIENSLYKIVRYFDNDGKPKQRQGGLFLFENDVWKKEFSETSKLNNWVSNNLGEQDTFLMTTLLTQNNDNDILAMTQKEQREHLEKVIGITKITKEVNLYKCNLNNLKYVSSLLRSTIDTTRQDVNVDDITEN